jgi:hypothetical protein
MKLLRFVLPIGRTFSPAFAFIAIFWRISPYISRSHAACRINIISIFSSKHLPLFHRRHAKPPREIALRCAGRSPTLSRNELQQIVADMVG